MAFFTPYWGFSLGLVYLIDGPAPSTKLSH